MKKWKNQEKARLWETKAEAVDRATARTRALNLEEERAEAEAEAANREVRELRRVVQVPAVVQVRAVVLVRAVPVRVEEIQARDHLVAEIPEEVGLAVDAVLRAVATDQVPVPMVECLRVEDEADRIAVEADLPHAWAAHRAAAVLRIAAGPAIAAVKPRLTTETQSTQR
jgi:hypothetical protein